MTGWVFLLVSKVFVVEYGYVIERYGGVPPGFGGHWDFLLNFVAHRPELFFFFFVTLFTCFALVFFCVHINTKYMRNLTMNEEFKYELPMKTYSAKLDRVLKFLEDKSEISYSDFDKVKADVGEVERWVTMYHKAYVDRSYFRELLLVLFF